MDMKWSVTGREHEGDLKHWSKCNSILPLKKKKVLSDPEKFATLKKRKLGDSQNN